MQFWRKAALALLATLALSTTLGCALREVPYSTLEARYGLASSQHYSPEPGLILHYTDEGRPSGMPIIMVHGFAASVHAWRPWIDRLADRYHLIAIDLPGHGLTQAPHGYQSSLDANAELVGKLADHLGIKTFVLIGNSMGGAVAWNFTLLHPDRVKALVLVDAVGAPSSTARNGEGPPLAFQLLSNPLGRALLKAVDPSVFAKSGLTSAYLDPSLVTDQLVARYSDLALAPGHRDILLTQQQGAGRKISLADFKQIAIPTLVLSGEQDKLIPVAEARTTAAAIPNARLITYPRVGHVPMEQIPDQSASDLQAFLEGLPANQTRARR